MRRLVDIDEVIRVAKDTFPEEDVLKIAWVITHTPTAYDIEKVVTELEEKSKWYISGEGKITWYEKGIKKDEALEIVRKGVIE